MREERGGEWSSEAILGLCFGVLGKVLRSVDVGVELQGRQASPVNLVPTNSSLSLPELFLFLCFYFRILHGKNTFFFFRSKKV